MAMGLEYFVVPLLNLLLGRTFGDDDLHQALVDLGLVRHLDNSVRRRLGRLLSLRGWLGWLGLPLTTSTTQQP
jgi:hypothetical protein